MNSSDQFPCPVCGQPLKIRESKKQKPYVVCDPCGVQMFVRNQEGISRFMSHVESGAYGDAVARLEAIAQRYRRECPKCGNEFWIDPEQVKTSWVDGSLEGFLCPRKGCKGIAPARENQ